MILQNTTPLFPNNHIEIALIKMVKKWVMDMMEEHSDCRKNLEMIYETKKNVDILNKEIENIKYRLDEFKLETKEDMKHIDDKLELILQDKKDSYNKIKQTIITVVITGLCALLASGAMNYIADTINK